LDTTNGYWWKGNNVRNEFKDFINEINYFYRNYVVEKRDKKSGDWVRCADAVNGTQVTVSKLKEGHEYEFRVMAENINGLSEPLVTDKGVLVKNPFSMFSVLFIYFDSFLSFVQ
jgi:hypothetical protein